MNTTTQLSKEELLSLFNRILGSIRKLPMLKSKEQTISRLEKVYHQLEYDSLNKDEAVIILMDAYDWLDSQKEDYEKDGTIYRSLVICKKSMKRLAKNIVQYY